MNASRRSCGVFPSIEGGFLMGDWLLLQPRRSKTWGTSVGKGQRMRWFGRLSAGLRSSHFFKSPIVGCCSDLRLELPHISLAIAFYVVRCWSCHCYFIKLIC